MTERAKKLVKRWRSLREERGQWYAQCDDLARVMLPSRLGFTSQTYPGDRRTEDIYDSTAMQARRGLANAVGSMLRPEGQQWIFIESADEDELDDEGLAWMADSEDRMRDAFDNPKARFRQATGEADSDLVTFGTANIFTSESDAMDHLRFQTIHPKDAVPVFSEEGSPNGMFRSRRMPLHQAVDMFGKDNLSELLRRKIEETKIDEQAEFLHAVFPRNKIDGRFGAKRRMMAKNLPDASLWIEVDSGHEVKESGYQEFPFAVPRWDTASGEDTGLSPGMIALPDANTLQAMEETLLIAGQRAAAPPLLVPNDSAFDAANTMPDGITYYDAQLARDIGRIPISPLETGAKMPIVLEMQDKKREQVWAAFMRNVLNLPVQGPQMTATEIIQRKEEMIREIGPVFGRLETDYTAPMVERAFMIMLRANAFLPIPESLAGRKIKFRYESPVKKIRRMVEAAAAQAWVSGLAEVEKVRPGTLDVVDFEEYARLTADASSVPSKIVVGRDKLREIRAQKEQQASDAMEAQMAQQMAGAVKTVGETPGIKQALEGAAGTGGQKGQAA